MAHDYAPTGHRRRQKEMPAGSAPQVGADSQPQGEPAQEEGRSLLASPMFWTGGLLSILLWILIATLFGWF